MVESAPERLLGLARWIADEAGGGFDTVLDALESVDAAINSREQRGDWSSEGYHVTFGPDVLTIEGRWDDDDEPALVYDLQEARDVIEEYAVYVMGLPEPPNDVREYFPELPVWQADLLVWEERWKRRHPYRGRLGIPT